MKDRHTAQQIKLMADYNCWPLWWWGDHDPDNIDPSTLPLSPETIMRLRRWAAAFSATLNRADPASSDFPSDAAFEAFEAEGEELWHLLREELAPDYTVCYYSLGRAKLLDDPSSL
jgi:hypothetical protein